ncbi:MAG: ferrous iron transport protein B [Gammaproteobacteria bacterium]|nr:ferrous iron transport protein B [Gammaproteobacteria bacterium]
MLIAAVQTALIGNPNCGKTTIFNNLTNTNQKVGNWPGVTVEKKSGQYHYKNQEITVTDLPGLYSISPAPQNNSLDQEITNNFVINNPCDLYINILDAGNLKRNLYLTLQLVELGLPCIVIINMIDKATFKKLNIDLDNLRYILENCLNCHVLTISATKNIKTNILVIKEFIYQAINNNINKKHLYSANTSLLNNLNINPACLPNILELQEIEQYYKKLNQIAFELTKSSDNYSQDLNSVGLAIRALEHTSYSKITANSELKIAKDAIQEHYKEDPDIIIADLRYKIINSIYNAFLKIKTNLNTKQNNYFDLSGTLDRLFLNKYLGIPIFLFLLYSVFELSISLGGIFKPFFELPSQFLANQIVSLANNSVLVLNLSHGLATGISTVASFIPQIAIMFVLLTYLEDSGYMARAAFIMDRLMLAVGLPGKSFLPLIISFGCNVPAIMATRTLNNHYDRILTCLMAPFMSCSARLAIFIIFASTFFPERPALMVFILYIIGIIVALLTGLILKKNIFVNNKTPLILELPSYNWPNLRTIALTSWQHIKSFILRAGKLIIPICITLQLLNSIEFNGKWVSVADHNSEKSILAEVSKTFTPLLNPIGVTNDNWPATVGLITGSLAKEIVVGTLNTLYSSPELATNQNTNQNTNKNTTDLNNIFAVLNQAKLESLALLQNLFSASHYNFTDNSNTDFSLSSYNKLSSAFPSVWAAFAYCLFVLLYIPCLSTFSTLIKEIGRSWAIASLLWSLDIAYCSATMVYQASNILVTPIKFLLITGIIIISHMLLYLYIKKNIKNGQPNFYFNTKNNNAHITST